MLLILLWTSHDPGKWNFFMESNFVVRKPEKNFLASLKICFLDRKQTFEVMNMIESKRG